MSDLRVRVRRRRFDPDPPMRRATPVPRRMYRPLVARRLALVPPVPTRSRRESGLGNWDRRGKRRKFGLGRERTRPRQLERRDERRRRGWRRERAREGAARGGTRRAPPARSAEPGLEFDDSDDSDRRSIVDDDDDGWSEIEGEKSLVDVWVPRRRSARSRRRRRRSSSSSSGRARHGRTPESVRQVRRSSTEAARQRLFGDDFVDSTSDRMNVLQ